jgi:adenylate cyclase
MFSDIAGYTALMGRDETGAVHALAEHRDLMRSLVPRFNGRIIGDIGDGTLSSFHSAVDAVNCAREAQAKLRGVGKPKVRIGIHVGDVLFSDEGVMGDGVNVASRIHALAPPGGICISERVYDDIRNKPGMQVKDLGRPTLKNVARPIRIFELQIDATADEPPYSRWRISRRTTIGASMMLVAFIAIFLGYPYRSQLMPSRTMRGRSDSVPSGGGKATVAVLPFANLSADQNDEYFSDGMTDEIMGQLSKIAGLQVAARSSSFQFKNKNEDATKVGGMLHVGHLLEGSVRRSAGRIRIEVELIDAASGFTLWSERYDEQPADVFEIQTAVAQRVAEKLRVNLLANERERLERKPTANLEAYNQYLLGRFYFAQFSEEGWTKAIECYSRAVQLDPNFALAYEALGEAYGMASSFTLPPREATPKAKASIERALALDDTLGGAHGAMAYDVLYSYDWNWPAAEREFKRALELDPSNAQTHGEYGEFLTSMSRFDEALKERFLARDLDPLQAQSLVGIARVYREARQYDKAMDWLGRAIEMTPGSWAGYQIRATIFDLKGDMAGALRDAAKADSLAHSPFTKSLLGGLQARTGRRDEALKILAELKQLAARRYVDPICFVDVYFSVGDLEEGFRRLDQAYADRSSFLLNMNNPVWHTLWGDPRFEAIYAKVGLPPHQPWK